MKKYIIAIFLCLLPGVTLYASDALFLNEHESALFGLIGQVNKNNEISFYYEDLSTPFIFDEIEEKRNIAKVYVNKTPIYYTLKYREDFEIEFFEYLNMPSQPDYYLANTIPRTAFNVQHAYLNDTEFGYIYGEAVALEYIDGTISFSIGWTDRVKTPSKTFPEIFITKETLKDFFKEMTVSEAKERLTSIQYDENRLKENDLITISYVMYLIALLYNSITFRKNITKTLVFQGILGAVILTTLLIITELKDTLTTPLFGYGSPLFITMIISVALYIGKYKVEDGEEMFP